MKRNPWTLALIGAGLISLPAVMLAEEKPPSSVLTSLAPTTLSGYVDTSAQWNIGTGNGSLPPIPFEGSSKADGFNLNVVKLTLEKPIDVADVWAAGYKVDLLFGPDANTFFTQSSGITGDFGIKQAYVALHAPVGNGLDFKLGVWDTVIGYEVFESPNNPNFTRSYGFAMEPTTHTGLLASYQFCDFFSANVGVANTFGPTINGKASPPFGPKAESFKTYMGAFTLTAPTNSGVLAGSTLTAGVINGFNQFVGNETSWYVGATLNTPVTGLKVGFAFDDLDVHDVSGENWVVGTYVAFQATEKLGLYARAEYMKNRGNEKLFTSSISDGDPLDPTFVTSDLAPDQVLGLTGTVQYDLWKNVLSRLEVRWDHSLSGNGVWGGTASPSFDNPNPGNQKNAVMVLANIVYRF